MNLPATIFDVHHFGSAIELGVKYREYKRTAREQGSGL
jgi:hypothetical protein